MFAYFLLDHIFLMEAKKDLLTHLMSICVMPSLVVSCSPTRFKSCTALHFSALGDNTLYYIWKIFPNKNISIGTNLSL